MHRQALVFAAALCVSSLACDGPIGPHGEEWDPFHCGYGGLPAEDGHWTGANGNLTLLPLETEAACLDGSPYGFYFTPSPSGRSTKWTISIEGGGWCYNETLCYERSHTDLGSSKNWAPSAGCRCMNVEGDDLDDDCNCLYMPYGDGASFSGYRRDPWPVPSAPGNYLHFRGIKNLDATVEYALKNLGLDKATDFVLTGGSAGGLSTFLHMDRVSAMVKAHSPNCVTRGAPVVGYFLDHDNYAHDSNNYTAWMHYIYGMQNLTAASGALNANCLAAFPDDPHYCFMSPHMQSFIRTPFFVFNSKYDAWQLANELQTKWTTKAEQDAVLQYGQDFLKQFAPIQTEHQNGAMITSCICHGCPWDTLVLQNKTSYQHYAAWHEGKTIGAAAVHIDPRGPNGDGAITDKSCQPFP